MHGALEARPLATERTALLEQIDSALARWRRHGGTVLVAFVDIDRFARINETWGYRAGDAVLDEIGVRLREHFRAEDTVFRLGADFAVLCTGPDPVTDHAIVTIGERVKATVEDPVPVDGGGALVSASAGIATARGTSTAESLLREAEGTAATAKRRGGGQWVVADPATAASTSALQELEHALRSAIDEDQLVLHYQPIVDVRTSQVVAVEALVRWARPGVGLVVPGEFIPVAEESGLIVPLGRWVLEQVARDAVSHPLLSGDVTGSPLTVSVNVSARQLRRPALPALVRHLLTRTGRPKGGLCIELTESALVSDVHEAAAILRELQSVGCGIAIDDFGTGWSSLSHLRHFPVDALKIDRSFVDGVVQPDGERAIAQVIVTLAHALGLAAVAEGVETDEQLGVLRAMGCDRAQGFHIARPMPLDELAEEVARWL